MNMHKLGLVIIQHNQKEALLGVLMRLEPLGQRHIGVVVVDYDCMAEQVSDSQVRKHPLVFEHFKYEATTLVEKAVEKVAKFMAKSGYTHLWILKPKMHVTTELAEKANACLSKDVSMWGRNFWGMLFRIEDLIKLGGFESVYFLGMADYDYAYRVDKSGGKIGPAFLSQPGEQMSRTKAYFWGKNPWVFIRLRKVTAFRDVAGVGWQSLKHFQVRYWQAYVQGMVDGLMVLVRH